MWLRNSLTIDVTNRLLPLNPGTGSAWTDNRRGDARRRDQSESGVGQAGFGPWTDKFAPHEITLKKLFLAAKAAHTGLWSAPDPVPPWIFRNGSRSIQAVIVK